MLYFTGSQLRRPCKLVGKTGLAVFVGEWLSLVEHLVRDQGVGGSNPLSPTNFFKQMQVLTSDHLVFAQAIYPANPRIY